jgi:hypothetical protein
MILQAVVVGLRAMSTVVREPKRAVVWRRHESDRVVVVDGRKVMRERLEGCVVDYSGVSEASRGIRWRHTRLNSAVNGYC